MEDFKTYFQTQTNKERFDDSRSSLVTRMTERDTVLTGMDMPGYATERNNFLIFSTYRITQSHNGELVEKGSFLGIAGMFFELGDSEAMAAHAAQP
jgi:hypothetical protein